MAYARSKSHDVSSDLILPSRKRTASAPLIERSRLHPGIAWQSGSEKRRYPKTASGESRASASHHGVTPSRASVSSVDRAVAAVVGGHEQNLEARFDEQGKTTVESEREMVRLAQLRDSLDVGDVRFPSPDIRTKDRWVEAGPGGPDVGCSEGHSRNHPRLSAPHVTPSARVMEPSCTTGGQKSDNVERCGNQGDGSVKSLAHTDPPLAEATGASGNLLSRQDNWLTASTPHDEQNNDTSRGEEYARPVSEVQKGVAKEVRTVDMQANKGYSTASDMLMGTCRGSEHGKADLNADQDEIYSQITTNINTGYGGSNTNALPEGGLRDSRRHPAQYAPASTNDQNFDYYKGQGHVQFFPRRLAGEGSGNLLPLEAAMVNASAHNIDQGYNAAKEVRAGDIQGEKSENMGQTSMESSVENVTSRGYRTAIDQVRLQAEQADVADGIITRIIVHDPVNLATSTVRAQGIAVPEGRLDNHSEAPAQYTSASHNQFSPN